MQIWDSYRRKSGLAIVVSGPSGVGKDTVLDEFVKVCPEVTRCVTVTTRQPRVSEQHGLDYSFVTEQEFRRMIDLGEFLEYAEVHGNLYGTPKSWVAGKVSAGQDCLLKIDVQGGIAVKKQIPEAVMVFLVPPSMEELERRLRTRSTDSEEAIEKRLQNARHEMEQIPYYEYIVENDLVENAAAKLRAIVVAEHSRIVSPR